MKAKSIIRKLVVVSLWVAAGGGLVTLLLAANSKGKKGMCSDYTVTIKGIENNYFITKGDVVRVLKSATQSSIQDKPMAEFDLQALEKLLEDNVWIKDAELWFDNKSVLHIRIEEREPVARIFTSGSGSFYIDRDLRRMPLSGNVSIRIPVFTGFPEQNNWNRKDSLLAADVRSLAEFITAHDFWNALVAQVSITERMDFDLVPVVGNNIIHIGGADNLNRKFERLYVFYNKVLRETGFDRYSEINVQYKGQVVATRRGTSPGPVDLNQLKKNVARLLDDTRMLNKGSDVYIKPAPAMNEKKPVLKLEPPADIPEDPEPVGTDSGQGTGQQVTPRAVMPKRNEQ